MAGISGNKMGKTLARICENYDGISRKANEFSGQRLVGSRSLAFPNIFNFKPSKQISGFIAP